MKSRTEKDCMRCGACCKTNLFAYVAPPDIERWVCEDREDILEFLDRTAPVWAGDRLVSPETGRHFKACPFYKWDGKCGGCAIYEVRPDVCRRYKPGHNEMCPQFKGETPGGARYD